MGWIRGGGEERVEGKGEEERGGEVDREMEVEEEEEEEEEEGRTSSPVEYSPRMNERFEKVKKEQTEHQSN